ncbi:hypothetical protein ACP70R_041750 [Stipagrostis hirtigluma subsp. patula]
MKQEVFDKDTFSKGDKKGDAESDIEALIPIIQMDLEVIGSGSGSGGEPESHIIWDCQIVQDLLQKLRNVETGMLWCTCKAATEMGEHPR